MPGGIAVHEGGQAPVALLQRGEKRGHRGVAGTREIIEEPERGVAAGEFAGGLPARAIGEYEKDTGSDLLEGVKVLLVLTLTLDGATRVISFGTHAKSRSSSLLFG